MDGCIKREQIMGFRMAMGRISRVDLLEIDPDEQRTRHHQHGVGVKSTRVPEGTGLNVPQPYSLEFWCSGVPFWNSLILPCMTDIFCKSDASLIKGCVPWFCLLIINPPNGFVLTINPIASQHGHVQPTETYHWLSSAARKNHLVEVQPMFGL